MIYIPKINKLFFIRWVLVFALLSQSLPVLFPSIDFLYEKSVSNSFVLTRTYIKEIQGDMQSVSAAQKALDYFNSLGDNTIVKYHKPDTEFTRPIVIKVGKLSFIDQLLDLAGYAIVTPFTCDISIEPWEDRVMFEQVLIHEYLHCMGYLEHSEDDRDIMYPSYKPVWEANIIKYAKELKKKLK